MAASFQVVEGDHVVTDLKAGSAGSEFVRLEPVSHMTDNYFRDSIEVDDRFQSKVMIAFEHFHRLFFRFEPCRHDQIPVLDLPVFLRDAPSFPVVFSVKIIRVDERSRLKHLRLEGGRIGGIRGRRADYCQQLQDERRSSQVMANGRPLTIAF